MFIATPSLRPCKRDQVQRVAGISAPPLSRSTPRGWANDRRDTPEGQASSKIRTPPSDSD